MKVIISYKSQIKLSQLQKEKIDNGIFVLNQLYNFLIDFFLDEKNQKKLIDLELAKTIIQTSKSGKESEKVVLQKYQKIVTEIDPLWKDYAEVRKLKTKGLSKPIQTKMLDFVKNFNSVNLSSKKDFNFKISSPDNYGSISTDSSIKLFKKKVKLKNKKKTKYYVKIGKEIYRFKNQELKIKNFTPKTATISRKNGKYYLSLTGYKQISQIVIDKSKNIGIDVNFETISRSDGVEHKLHNLQNKLNLYTKQFQELKQQQSKRTELAKETLKTICKADGIDIYKENSSRMTKEAKTLYKSILSSDKIYCRLKKEINNKYEKRTNIQDDLYRKIAKEIFDNYDLCFIENLDVVNMVNSRRVKNINLYNVALGKMLLTIKNKAYTTGKVIVEVDPQYTSKTCSNCKSINNDLKMEREWMCPTCQAKHNRDINAARNIQQLGILSSKSGTGL